MNIFKHIVSITILVLALTSCEQKHNLVAQIDGIENDTILIQYVPLSKLGGSEGNFMFTSLVANNNTFAFDNPIKESIIAMVFQKKFSKKIRDSFYVPTTRYKYLEILLKSESNISIKGTLKDYYLDYNASGSKFQTQFSETRNKHIKETSQIDHFRLQIDRLRSNNGDKEDINKLFKEIRSKRKLASQVQMKFIQNNWDNDLSGYYLSKFNIDTLGKYYKRLSTNVKKGIFKGLLDKKILNFKAREIRNKAPLKIIKNSLAPNFTLKSIDGEEIALHAISKKYIVLDFWGSWCGYCIKGFPKMKEYYSKYKDKVEFIGIDCNDTDKNWKEAVKKYNLPWMQLYNTKELKKDVSVTYGIKAYPTKIILDKNKIIVGVFTSESDAFYTKLDELLK